MFCILKPQPLVVQEKCQNAKRETLQTEMQPARDSENERRFYKWIHLLCLGNDLTINKWSLAVKSLHYFAALKDSRITKRKLISMDR